MRNKILLGIAALLIGSGGALAVSTPAQAAYTDCPATMFCVWYDGNYSGARWQVSYGTLVDAYQNGVALPSWIDDQGSAVYNRTGYSVYMFDGSNCGSVGWHRLVTANQKLTAPGSAINDRISSVQLYGAYPLLCNL